MVLTVIGSDRPGLVQTLADIVVEQGGNWERSQLAQLAGAFAGILVVNVPDTHAVQLRASLEALGGVLHVGIYEGEPVVADMTGQVVRLDLLGNDRPGIVRELSAVFARHGISIDDLTTQTREAPMAGGQLFEAHVSAVVASDEALHALRVDLEAVAAELMVDVTLDTTA